MQLRIMILAVVLLMVVAAPAVALTFEFLTLPTNSSAGWDISSDGSRAVANFQGQVYLMDEAGNFTLINTLVQPSAGKTSISGDGHTIVTNTHDPMGFQVPVIMREAEGWTAHILEMPDGYEPCDHGKASGYDVNGDGTKVTGLLWDSCDAKCFLWTEETGMQDLGPTRGSTISQDGSVIGGFNSSQRRPSYWPVEGNIGLPSVLLHHEEDYGEVHDITSNGEILVGTGLPYGYDPILTGYQAFIYEMGDPIFTLLGTMSGSPNDISVARFIADNGVIIGTSGPSSINVQTFIWTPEIGMTSLEQYLVDAGVTEIGTSVNLTWPRAFSEDGSTFIGEYVDLYGGWGYYRVRFSQTSPVPDLTRRAAARLTDISPNPFNPMTTVSFSLDKSQKTTVTVYDISGRKVAVIADDVFDAGEHRLVWRGKDQAGREVSSGSYVVRLESQEGSDSRTISLVR